MITEDIFMERRDTLKILAATTGAILASRDSLAFAKEKKETDHKKHHGHHGHHTKTAEKTDGKKEPGKLSFGDLNHAAAHCNHVAQMCAGHCLELIKDGQKSMVECLQAALEVQAMSAALSDLAGLRSDLCAAQAKACILACEKCMKACEPHVGHHEQCKECFEACKSCMETCKSFAV
jgi:Cys-rich four helix bundle protein (predicted Tat secretion target)